MTTHTALNSTPALVLTLGSGLVSAAGDAKRIFFQSDLRRNATTRFLTLNFQAKQPQLTEVARSESEKKFSNISSQRVRALVREHAGSIHDGIRSVLHELRSHEKLIEVGLGGKPHLPLDVIILADATEAESDALPTLLPLIHSLLTDEPYARVHLLLGIAVFLESKKAYSKTHETLQALLKILEDKEQLCLPQVYIFDRYKEGVWEVRDMDELRMVMGNFLLALLSGGLAQRLAYQVAQLDVTENQAYFCGASATALVFDVDQLQKACAMRLGAEILDMEFHSKNIPDPAPMEEIAADFSLKHANPRTWTARLCQDSLFHPQVETNIELHFSDLRFEDLPMEDWVKTIQTFDTHFNDVVLPLQADLIQRNACELNDEFLAQANRFIQTLPQQARLYPGGVTAARMVLEKIQKNIQEVRLPLGDVSGIEHDCNAQIKVSLEKLEKTMSSLPKPPVWVLRLPGFLRKPAVQLFNLLFLYRELQALTDLRQNSVRLMEQKYESLMKEVIHQKLKDLTVGWGAVFEKQKKLLRRLQSALDALQSEFTLQRQTLISSPSLFRLSALDESVLGWAYYYGKRPPDGFRHALLGEQGFLLDWQKVKIQTFQQRLERFCGGVYEPLASMDLEEALHHRDGKDASSLSLSMMQGAVPLLRPNFDQTGSGSSYQLRFMQCKDPSSSSLIPTLKNDEQEWEYISTNDPLLATCCRVRMMIPKMALAHVFERGSSNGGTS